MLLMEVGLQLYSLRDETAKDFERIYVSAGKVGYQVELSPDDLVKIVGCKFAEKLFDNPSEYLSRGASEKISEAIQKDFDLAAEMTMQFGEHRASEEADYGSLWAYHERGEGGLDDYWLGYYDPFDTSEMDNDPYFTSQEYINDGWD